MSKLEDILADITNNNASVTTKTASAAPAPEPTAEDALLATVRDFSQKIASQGAAAPQNSALAHVEKVASDLAQAENLAMLKQAEIMGTVFADGVMARLANYESAVTKTAAAGAQGGYTQDDLEKVAQAAYAQAQQDFEKQAAAEYEQGYRETEEQIFKLAAEAHYAGQCYAREIVKEASNAASRKILADRFAKNNRMTDPKKLTAAEKAREFVTKNKKGLAGGAALGAGVGAGAAAYGTSRGEKKEAEGREPTFLETASPLYAGMTAPEGRGLEAILRGATGHLGGAAVGIPVGLGAGMLAGSGGQALARRLGAAADMPAGVGRSVGGVLGGLGGAAVGGNLAAREMLRPVYADQGS